MDRGLTGRLTLSQLRAIEALARTGSFTLAARELGVAQPSISNHVQSVENRFRARLFLRRNGAVTPAPRLAEILPQIRSILALGQDVERELGDGSALSGGELRIGYSTYQTAIPRIARFMHRYPEIRIEARAGATDDVLALLENGQIDAGLVSAREVPAQLEGLALLRTRIVLAVLPTHPLAGRRRIEWREIAGLPLIQREKGSGTRRIFEAAATVARVRVQTRLALGCWGSLTAMVRAGGGVAVAQEAEIQETDQLAAVGIADGGLSVTHFLVCRREMRNVASVAALFEVLRQDDVSVSTVDS